MRAVPLRPVNGHVGAIRAAALNSMTGLGSIAELV